MYASKKELARLVSAELYPEGYPEKLWRITRSPESRIMSTHHGSKHQTTYILRLDNKRAPILLPVVCGTICVMKYDASTRVGT